MTHDLAPSGLVVRWSDLLSAPRMDNQVICHVGTHALGQAVNAPHPMTRVLALFDHEEVGSMSDRGAFSSLIATTLERMPVTGRRPAGFPTSPCRVGGRVRRHGPITAAGLGVSTVDVGAP
jgi:aspartyl aminopeptidase